MTENIKVPEGIRTTRNTKPVNGELRHPCMGEPPYGKVNSEFVTHAMPIQIYYEGEWYPIIPGYICDFLGQVEEDYIKIPLSKILKEE